MPAGRLRTIGRLRAGGIIPSLILDFTTGSLDSRITASGGANGTRVDASGNIVAATTPRFDYDPTTLAIKGVLIEEARTNIALQSAAFDNASWTPGLNIAVTANQVTAPDGTAAGDLATISGIGNGLYQTVTVTASTAYTFTVFAKMGTLAVADFKFAFYDATAAAFIVTDVSPSSSVDYGNGWKRYSYTVTTPVGCVSMRAYAFRNSAISAGTFYLWGAQLEAGSFAPSDIPTTAGTVTRTPDSLVMTGSNFSPWYPTGGLSGVIEFRLSAVTGTRPIWSFDDNTANQQIRLYASGTSLKLTVTDGGVTQADLTLGTVAASTTYKAGFRVMENDFAAVLSGGTAQTDAAGTVPTVDRARIGSDQAGNYQDGHVLRSRIYTPLPNSTLQVLTT